MLAYRLVERLRVADVREQILEEATRLFAARGFDGASLQDIASAVGVRKASLLYHVASKEELRREVLVRLLARWRERVPRLLLAAASGRDQFEAVTSELVEFFAADPDRARLLLREALDRPAEMRELLEAHVRPWIETVCDQVRKGQRAGRVRSDVDPEAYVVQVVNLVVGSFATVGCLGALVGGDGATTLDRHVAEMRRVARTSLFVNGGAGRGGAQPAAARGVEKPRTVRGGE
jgi:AcrR family transcriptional regulator